MQFGVVIECRRGSNLYYIDNPDALENDSINQLAQHGYVERELINQHANRCSSGIVLVLSQVPFIEEKDKPRKALYVKTNF